MDPRVVPSQVHENNENPPHVDSQQEENNSEYEKKSVLNKVKEKARKIKDSIKKHGQHVFDHGHDQDSNEDQNIPDDHDLGEDKEIVEVPEVQGASNYENDGFKSTTPASEKVENFGKSGSDFGSTTVMGEEQQPHHDPLVGGVSSTTEMNRNIATEPVKTYAEEEKPEPSKVDFEKPIVLEDDPHTQGNRPEAYTLPSHETKVTDPSGAGSDEIKDITPVEESFERMNVHDEPKPTPEPKVLPEIADTAYPPTRSHDQFLPHLSAATETQDPSARTHDQFSSEKISTNINRNPEIEEQTFNPITTTVEEQPSVEKQSNQENSYTDEISSETADITVPPQNSEASEIGYDERNYKVSTDEDITPVEESFERMNVHDEPKPTPEPKVLPEIADTAYPPTRSHDQFLPHLSAATETQDPSARTHDQFSSEKISTNINRNPEIEEQTFNPITTTVEEQPSVEKQSNQENSYTDEISSETADITVSPQNSEASEIGYDERNYKVSTDEEQQKSDVSDKPVSTSENGKSIAQSLTEKLAPVYGKVAEVGSTVKSKVYVTTSTDGVGTEAKNEVEDQNKGVALKDHLAEKLKPGEEDKALSEVISEALYKGKEEEVKKEHLSSGNDESEKVFEEESQGKGVVDRVKGVVGSWFAKSGENQPPKGAAAEDLSNDKNSGTEVMDERRTKE